jgi:hypothetical protein
MTDFDERLWDAVRRGKDTVLEPPLSPWALAAFEAGLGLALPASHREFLLRANGGEIGVARLFGVGRPGPLDLEWEASEMRLEFEGTAAGLVLPIAKDWGGSYFCYDLQRSTGGNDRSSLYWNHEYSEEPEDRPMLWSDYAPNFLGFLRKIMTL